MNEFKKILNTIYSSSVEYKSIDELLKSKQILIITPSFKVKRNSYKSNGKNPIISQELEYISGFCDLIDKNIPEGEYICFGDHSEHIKFVNFSFVQGADGLKIIKIINKNINAKYLYYAISSNYKRHNNYERHFKYLEKTLIPIPPLEVQREIVHILDDFTLLTAELTAELTARKKQYEYYEYNLFWNTKYKKVKLSEVCKVNQGLQIPISKRFKENGKNRYLYITVQFLKNKESEQYYIENPDKNVICDKEDILVTRTGSTGVIITGVQGCFHNNFFKVECNGKINKRYMYYLLRSKHMYNKMLSAASGGTVPDLPHKKFYNLEIPLPELEEQERIVSILDRFDKLCNDISEGLPAEIESRKKQYEYYRDKLLDFEEFSKK